MMIEIVIAGLVIGGINSTSMILFAGIRDRWANPAGSLWIVGVIMAGLTAWLATDATQSTSGIPDMGGALLAALLAVTFAAALALHRMAAATLLATDDNGDGGWPQWSRLALWRHGWPQWSRLALWRHGWPSVGARRPRRPRRRRRRPTFDYAAIDIKDLLED